MGFNMVPYSRLMTKRSKVKKRSSTLVVSKRRKELKSRGENEAEADLELKLELFSSMIDELLTEIFLRLPIDSVCRFKLVCKHWCSLLSSDYFVSRFTEYNHNQQCPFTLVFQYSVFGPSGNAEILNPIGAISNHPVLSKSLRNRPLDLNFKRDFNDNFLKIEPMRVMASCHDLLLCGHFGSLYVVNLLTRCWIHIPPPPIRDQDRERTILNLMQYPKAGLLCSHDNKNGDGLCKYKVILLPGIRSDIMFPQPCVVVPPEIYASQFSVRIFSSESRQWVDIAVDWYPWSLNAYLSCTPILSHEGKLHWLNGPSLVSLDANANNLSCHSVDLPNELSIKPSLIFGYCFGVCQGKFRLARLIYKKADGGTVLLVWDLEDYHKGVWQSAHRVILQHQPSLKKYDYRFRLMAFHPFDRDMVFVDMNGVFQFNMRTGILESYHQLKLEKGCYCRMLQQPSIPLLFHRGFPTAVSVPS
ncbi:uncharacterized protein LOC110715668 [Chenopodium quinoa]|uniref:uncharacterized protein LOC110709036 n=1 Tax=Chenopodium quinoa TaxID=63459 RepID=UPI000B78A0E2|nr:uncharacterized protein LOC110709036 [Chenopodium quinoa]XP_021749959.1 uncharacterized protein LOC110715668 [Chenopodium quinoa]